MSNKFSIWSKLKWVFCELDVEHASVVIESTQYVIY